MDRTHVVEGNLSDPRHIELDEPLSNIQGRVQVTVRPISAVAAGSPQAVLQAMRALPDLDPGDVDELERMIEAGKRPAESSGLFNAEDT